MATIDSGPVEAWQRFRDVPKSKWRTLVNAKRYFLEVKVGSDCRYLVEFCEDAEVVWQDLGYGSAAAMIRDGYKLDPVEIELAVAWLKHNEPQQEIGLSDVAKAVAKAIATKDKQQGKRNDLTSTKLDEVESHSNANKNILRRLARDAPAMLDKIESGELSVNQAAIAAGIRKKPTASDVCVAAFRKADNRLELLKRIIADLEPHEASIVRDWIIESLN